MDAEKGGLAAPLLDIFESETKPAPAPAKKADPYATPKTWIAKKIEEYYTYIMVSLFGFFGVTARVWLDVAWFEIGFAKNGAYPSVFLPTNVIGSFIMGIMVTTKDSIFAKAPILSIAISSGFCGSITTWSSWMTAAASALIKPDVAGWIWEISIGFSTSLLAVFVGYHVGRFATKVYLLLSPEEKVKKLVKRARKRQNTIRETLQVAEDKGPINNDANDALFPDEKAPINFLEIHGEDTWEEVENDYQERRGDPDKRKTNKETLLTVMLGSVALLLLCSGLITIAILIATRRNWVRLYFALLFAPFGALLRHIIVSKNLKLSPTSIPWFTLLVNLVGTTLLALLTTFYNRYGRADAPPVTELYISDFHNPEDWLSILPAVGSGFCGALTTVSTFVNEVRKSPLKVSYPYVFISLLLSQTVAVFILVSIYY